MSQVNRKADSGNRILVQLDGQQIGTMKSCRMNDDYGLEPVSGIGDIHVQEYVPTLARHNLSCSYVVLSQGALRKLGIATVNGDDALKGLVFDIVTQRKDTGETIRKYVGCSYASGDLDINANAIVMASATFNALDVTGDGG